MWAGRRRRKQGRTAGAGASPGSQALRGGFLWAERPRRPPGGSPLFTPTGDRLAVARAPAQGAVAIATSRGDRVVQVGPGCAGFSADSTADPPSAFTRSCCAPRGSAQGPGGPAEGRPFPAEGRHCLSNDCRVKAPGTAPSRPGPGMPVPARQTPRWDPTSLQMQTVRHSEQTLKTALISKNPTLVSQYEKLDAGERRLLNKAFKADNDLFGPITLHSESDWIISHPEAPQDFEQFFSDPYRKAPSPEKRSIYIQCIGSLGNTRIISDEYIKWLKGYCEAFFYGLTVKLLEPVPVSVTRCSFRVNDNTQNLQIHAGDILRFLKKKKPGDAFCIVGITMIDLYPRDSWNFVFGQASLTDGVGIFSFARYGSDFYSSRFEGKVNKLRRVSSSDYSVFENYYTPEVTSVLLLRSCKTLTHEIGHIFGLRHCQWLACLMQGSNHLEEADRRPLNLCPICLRKLQCAIGFNIIERYQALVRWIDDESADTPGVSTEHSCEDNVNLPKPVEAFKEWKEWIIKCLAVVQK